MGSGDCLDEAGPYSIESRKKKLNLIVVLSPGKIQF